MQIQLISPTNMLKRLCPWRTRATGKFVAESSFDFTNLKQNSDCLKGLSDSERLTIRFSPHVFSCWFVVVAWTTGSQRLRDNNNNTYITWHQRHLFVAAQFMNMFKIHIWGTRPIRLAKFRILGNHMPAEDGQNRWVSLTNCFHWFDWGPSSFSDPWSLFSLFLSESRPEFRVY